MSSSLPYIKKFTKYLAQRSKDGEGATVYRAIGSSQLDHLDPFLLLDEFHVSPPAGFPFHPHRGFETVTYMIGGSFKHEDNKGRSGTIGEGGVQWMTAGRGIIHSEMPVSNGDNYGLQLWVNLKKKDKMCKPQYQELSHDKLESMHLDEENCDVTVVAGESHGLKSKVSLRTEVLYVDVKMNEKGKTYVEKIPKGMQGFVYVHKGTIEIGEQKEEGEDKAMFVFKEDDKEDRQLSIYSKNKNCRVFIIAGEKMNEPIARYGPFVMNTQDEIVKAFRDYQSGKFA